MFIVATVYFSVRMVQDKKPSDAILAGLMLGLAMSTKFSAAPVALAVGTAHLLLMIGPALIKDGTGKVDPNDVKLGLQYVVLSGATAVIALLVTQPYMIIDWDTYVGNVYRQSEMVRRVVDFPFTRQYIDTPAFLYQIRQLSTWGLGISLGIAVWIGLIWAIARTLIKRDLAFVVVLSFLLPYLLINGQFEVKFLRYMLPATPLLIVFTGCAIWWAHISLMPRVGRFGRIAGYSLAIVGFLLLAHYAVAYTYVFTGPHPAQEVSRWLREREDAGTVVIQEHWEEGIPHIRDVQNARKTAHVRGRHESQILDRGTAYGRRRLFRAVQQPVGRDDPASAGTVSGLIAFLRNAFRRSVRLRARIFFRASAFVLGCGLLG